MRPISRDAVRVVPDAVVRRGAYVAPDVVLMPCYVNIGAYVDRGTMVHVGADVHVAGHQHDVGRNVGAATHDGIGNDAHSIAGEIGLGVVRILQRHLVEEAAVRAVVNVLSASRNLAAPLF